MKLTMYLYKVMPINSSLMAKLCSPLSSSPRPLSNYRKKRGKTQLCPGQRHGLPITLRDSINSWSPCQIMINSHKCSTTIGKIEEKNWNSPYLENYGIQIQTNTIIYSLSNPEKRRRETWEGTIDCQKMKLPKKWRNSSY